MGEGSEGISEGVLQRGKGSGLQNAQSLFDLGPAFLDGVEVGRIGRQIEQRRSGLANAFGNTLHLMGTQVVHDHDLTGSELRTQYVIQVSQEDVSVGGRFNRHDSDPAGNGDGAQYGHRSPVASRNAFMKPGATHGAAIAPRHLRGDATFVEEDEPRRIDLPGFAPAFSLGLDPFEVLLSGVERLFFKRSPICFSTSHSRPMLRWIFRSRCTDSCNFASVTSGCAPISDPRYSRTSGLTLLCRPLFRPAGRSICPVCSCAEDIFFAQPTLTRNRAASWRRLPSPSR